MGGRGLAHPLQEVDIDGNWKWFNTSALRNQGSGPGRRPAGSRRRNNRMDNRFFKKPILNSPDQILSLTGSSTPGPANSADHRNPPSSGVHHTDPEAQEAKRRSAEQKSWCSMRATGSGPRSSVMTTRRHQCGSPNVSTRWRASECKRLGCHPGNDAPASALATSQVQ